MKKNYVIYVNNVAIKVSHEVYKTYWKSVERERYLDKLAQKYELELDHVYDGYEANTIEYKLIDDKDPTRSEAMKLEMIDLLLKRVKTLPVDEQRLIQAIYFDELTQTEYARITNTSQQIISYRNKRILKKLRKLLE
ncbi:MAG: sigma-70 family RNA polymerase sigma factor [Erysipelotrichia bacterium]|nr:sigma-70 family RNA polymerase sigma factor [Erysipelotrichia bacterium]